MYEIKIVLEAIKDGALNPGEVVVKTGLPRYEILALFHVLEGLNLIEAIYSKGSHKVYKLTKKGKEILEGLEKGLELEIAVKGFTESVS
ncbi:hypothetical protein CM19_10245 [Candidatus Acidianus copahuensis]|uniref:ArnR1-like winged helix-turn-helix domain-containing protein n=1 Tax=Candidatus Acidianus copahuensis TaxID=1160895 RepID=A0A031LM23_9CREN|nr:hypothetical protein [Candidatus Acidianus copahuensis]EZQ03196.1 hypothetical protein CM19_10245 [Candidatus Acidianus copahuensis]NON61976.1 hypothetical protein [Acidianus sp. RZ1]